ncbi:ShlB/FhaC/HecB family hemolysin secretion/activation protein [Nostoc sp. ChiQUE01b]|uniref:ShlB/FhaC/HecB family hemolysin secretion/activation protein n=1 Tax=Nostoc sp. ChiQUE01b TaxID=3075376 RepID=UPI002AD207D2|nr:ShlB/FhaC/HecB family hemolysin secretion/activation protein [Nostoc sp. ChiQUE01b]MDZ8259043.1 ShlB/FhaC/HecB family hemolysin secretion/activation protein [Nostoc sp. ChiQUE01b]
MPKISYLNVFGGTFFIAASISITEPVLARMLAPRFFTQQIPTIPQSPQIPSFMEEPQQELQPPSLMPTPEIPKGNRERIQVERFVFKGNTVLSTQKLESVVASYTNREITFSELLEARTAVTNLYIQQGYVTSGAFFPVIENQVIPISKGIVTIQIVEGKLEQISIVGSARLQNYIRERLRTNTTKVFNSKHLLIGLQLLQTDPLIAKISAVVDKGSQLNTSVLNITVKPRQPFKIEAVLDNSRSPAIGTFQRRVELSNANLFGLGDRLSIGYRNTDGSNTLTTSYSIPINPQNGTVQFFYANSSANVVERPFSRLDILSSARAYEVTFRQPILQQANSDSTQEFALGLTASRLESESSLLNSPFPLSVGADSRGRTRISSIRFFQEWTQRHRQGALVARSQLSLGVGAIDATINKSAPDSRFLSWRGQVAWLRRLARNGTSLLVRTDIQFADQALVTLEQFGLGGTSSVRGYRQDTFLTDNGFLLSTQVLIPIWRTDTEQLELIPFFDMGTSWNKNADRDTAIPVSTSTLASIGIGIRYQLADRLSASLDWGIPLIEVNTNSDLRTWQENGVYFSINYRLF